MPKSIKIDQYRYMTNEAWRVLMAVEMGMKNHEFVPLELAHKISRCSLRGAAFLKLLRDDLVLHGLLAYETDNRKGYSGYRLTNLGYDYLALHTLIKSGQVADLGSMIGAGKESDVYLAVAGENCGRQQDETAAVNINERRQKDLPQMGDYIVIKFHRLGRTSFRKVREKREYHQGRNTCSWLYLDRLAAKREYEMMQVLYDHGLSVPCPLANNRNSVVMTLLSEAVPLCKVLPTTLRANDAALTASLYAQALDLLDTITRQGLVHGDFNEFNLLVSGLAGSPGESNDHDTAKAKLVLIDFPQMISRNHKTAQEIYERDLDGIVGFFGRYLEIAQEDLPPRSLSEIPRTGHIDVELKAPGYLRPKQASKIKGGRREVDNSDLLVGKVAALSVNRAEDTSEKESDIDSEGGFSSEESKSSEEKEEEDENASSEEVVSTTTSKVGKKTVTPTVIGRDEARERKRREEKRRAQNELRLRIKRQQRASIKSKNRKEIKAESRIFD